MKRFSIKPKWLWQGLLVVCLAALLALASCTPAGTMPPQDLYAEAQQARATSEAAVAQAEYQERFLTATAQAPIIHLTETAAGLIVQQTQASIDQTATAALFTPTITPSPTANATGTLMMVYVDAASTQAALEVERQETINTLQAVGGYALAGFVLVLTLLFAYVFMRRMAFVPNPIHASGRIVPMTNVLDGVAWDIEKATNGMIGTADKFLKALPAITAERQDVVTARSQMTDMAARVRLPRRLLDTQGTQALLPAPLPEIDTHFLLPSWDIINGWDGKGIPYYTANGLEVIDIERWPHLAVLGATGMGKSRRFIRPLIACALAAGQRVIIVGKSADYFPFAGHPNATLVKVNKLTEPEQALRYANILQAIVEEMNRRDEVLTAQHHSTWTHSGRNRTWIVLDELGNALRLMDRETSAQARIWVEGGVMEGRKVGFSFVIANQRATGMASILSQTGKAIFRVEAEEERAHRSLLGASSLHEGYFMARFGSPKIAGAFEPTDDELRQFLQSRPVKVLEDGNDWIDGVLVEQERLTSGSHPSIPAPAQSEPQTLASWKMTDREMKIIELSQQAGMSQREIEEVVFGYVGGAAAREVSRVVRKYRELRDGSATTTTTTTEKTPSFGLQPA
jgi:hypothetical protein